MNPRIGDKVVCIKSGFFPMGEAPIKNQIYKDKIYPVEFVGYHHGINELVVKINTYFFSLGSNGSLTFDEYFISLKELRLMKLMKIYNSN